MVTETTARMVPHAPPIPTVPQALPQESNDAPQQRKKRVYRSGLAEAIHSVIASTPGHSMHVDQACLRLQRTYPGIKPKELYNSLSKLKLSGHLKSTDTGCYLALTPIGVPQPPTEDENVSEGEDNVMVRFFNVYAELEAYLTKMNKKIEQYEKLKKAMNAVDID